MHLWSSEEEISAVKPEMLGLSIPFQEFLVNAKPLRIIAQLSTVHTNKFYSWKGNFVDWPCRGTTFVVSKDTSWYRAEFFLSCGWLNLAQLGLNMFAGASWIGCSWTIWQHHVTTYCDKILIHTGSCASEAFSQSHPSKHPSFMSAWSRSSTWIKNVLLSVPFGCSVLVC